MARGPMAIKISALLALAIFGTSCSQPAPVAPPDTRAQDEMAIRDAVKAGCAAAQAKDPDKFTSFYADDGVLLLDERPGDFRQDGDSRHHGNAAEGSRIRALV